MMKIAFIFISIFFVSGLNACSQPAPDNTDIKNLDAQQGWELIQKNAGNPDFILLDVRTPQEFNSGHIKNAININYYDSNFKEEINKLNKDGIYAVYCQSGRRAAASSDIMGKQGFKNINNIGGVKQWQDAGYKLTPSEKQ